jgi:hypothetical protein
VTSLVHAWGPDVRPACGVEQGPIRISTDARQVTCEACKTATAEATVKVVIRVKAGGRNDNELVQDLLVHVHSAPGYEMAQAEVLRRHPDGTPIDYPLDRAPDDRRT